MDKLLKMLREANPDKVIYTVNDPEFKTYGVVHPTVKVPKMREFIYAQEMPAGEFYVPCEEKLMEMDEAIYFTQFAYGETACQVGYYTGFCTKLNGVEYHKCSEVLVEFEPCVLIVGHIWDIEDQKLQSSDLKLFYCPPETCVELYATTLHFAPAMATTAGVRQVVCQTLTTNTPLHHPELLTDRDENPMLLERNKWVLIHEEAKAGFSDRAVVGIMGENVSVNPVTV